MWHRNASLLANGSRKPTCFLASTDSPITRGSGSFLPLGKGKSSRLSYDHQQPSSGKSAISGESDSYKSSRPLIPSQQEVGGAADRGRCLALPPYPDYTRDRLSLATDFRNFIIDVEGRGLTLC